MPGEATTFHTVELDQCQPEPLSARVVEGKLSHFLMIFDPSASMTEVYVPSAQCATCHDPFRDESYAVTHAQAHGGKAAVPAAEASSQGCADCHHDFLYTKFKFAKGIGRCFNRTIPAVDFTASLRTFGAPVYSATTYGPRPYAKESFDLALQKVIDVDGSSPLDQTLLSASKDWFAAEGRLGVVIVSDGKGMGDNEVLAAKELADRYGDRICLYTVQIGDDPVGAQVLGAIALASRCGVAVNGDALLPPRAMQEFVRQVFLRPAHQEEKGDRPVPALDASGSAPADVLFDFDRATLKPEGQALLDQLASLLRDNPGMRLAIGGHTDSTGTLSHNQTLSRQRAEAGLAYLVSQGIAKERIKVSWHAADQPVASNNNAAGRAKNRRLECKLLSPDD